jgi:hypothetical protein
MKVLLMRGAKGIGDLLFTTPIPRLLAAQGHEISISAWENNKAVYEANPHVKEIITCPDMNQEGAFEAWFDKVNAEYDKIVNLGFTVEKALLHRSDGFFGTIPPLEERRAAAAGHNYYDLTLAAAGIEGQNVLPELYPNELEQVQIDRLAAEKEEKGLKLVMWNFHGTTANKMLRLGPQWLAETRKRHPDSVHLVLGVHPTVPPQMLTPGKVLDFGGQWSLRTSMLMTALADVVVGPESAIVNAASAYNCHKVVIYSHSAPENLGKYWTNHHPILPLCKCAPCYLIPVNFRTLYHPVPRSWARTQEAFCAVKDQIAPFRCHGYHCTMELPHQEIIDTIISCLEA